MPEKICLVTAGGHISSFHAAMKAMYETLDKKCRGRFELVGAKGGVTGLVKGKIEKICYEDIEEDRAGSLIGCDRKVFAPEEVAKAIKNKIYAIVMMGGDDHLKDAAEWHDISIKVVGYPKTMDGDLSSFLTLGWETAVTIGATQTRHHYNTALTNERVFYVGLFGRNTDWILCPVSLYSCGDVAIPCEQEYELDFILEKIKEAVGKNKKEFGIKFAVVPYCEGAVIKGIGLPYKEDISHDDRGHLKLQPEWIGMELVRLSKKVGISACFQTHTYDLRDMPPTETDKKLSRMTGQECIEMILEGDFGKSVDFEPYNDFCRTSRKPLREMAKQKKLRETGYFDYDNLKATERFLQDYGNLFRASLGKPLTKNDLVYKNLRKN